MRHSPPDAEWLRTEEYQTLMNCFLTGKPDQNEAEMRTRSYRYRHFEVNKKLGVWRWRGFQEHLERVLPIIEAANGIIDFGGAGTPLGLGSTVFDIQKETLYGDPVCYHSLEETGVTYGAIFASHVLEHVPNWYRFIRECVRVLEPGGRVIFHVPAMSCKRWRGPSKALVPAHGDYYRCFHLEPTLEQVDSLFLPEATGLDIHCDWAGYVGDNSILYIGTRP